MEFSEFIQLVRQKKQTLVSVIILFVVFAVIITFLQPFRYSANSKLLVYQEAPAGIDPYQVSKANNYTSEVLAKVVTTNSFLNKVLASGFDINSGYFPSDQQQRLEKWEDTVDASTGSGSGIIHILVLHKDRLQADQLARAVNQVIANNHQDYHGRGKAVSVKVINEPYTSNMPARPNVPLNVGLGFALGLLVALSYVYLFPEKDYDLKMVPEKPAQPSKSKPNRVFREKRTQPETKPKPGQQPENTNQDHWRPVKNKPEPSTSQADDLDYEDIVSQGSMDNVFKK